MAKIQRSFYLEEDLARWLKVTAAKFSVSASSLLEQALIHYRTQNLPQLTKPPTETERRAMLDITDSLE